MFLFPAHRNGRRKKEEKGRGKEKKHEHIDDACERVNFFGAFTSGFNYKEMIGN